MATGSCGIIPVNCASYHIKRPLKIETTVGIKEQTYFHQSSNLIIILNSIMDKLMTRHLLDKVVIKFQ